MNSESTTIAPTAIRQPAGKWMLRSRDRKWRDTLAFVAHDLRNPLSVVRGAAELIDVRVGDADPEARRRVRMIHRAVDRMATMLDDLMLLARPTSPHPTQAEHRTFDVAELLATTLEVYGPSAADAGVRLSLVAESDVRAYADARAITRVVENLLSNALRHTPRDGEIRVTVREIGAELEIEIADTGQGIASRDMPHIFDRFWTSPDGLGRGTGLGLTISKHLVEANGGRIAVHNPPGAGASFRFSIPAADPIP